MAWLGEGHNTYDGKVHGTVGRFRITAEGMRPLLMHNSRLSNPLDDIAKAMKRISGKRTKTDEDHEEMARLEHAGGMYWTKDLGPYVPGQNFERALLDAAKKSKRGPAIKQGVFIETEINPLAYDGPRDLDGLWGDKNFVQFDSAKVQQSRVQRCRPVFHHWKVDAFGTYDENILNFEEIQEIAGTAGHYIGLGDWRPRYGRFTATVEELEDSR